MEHASHRRQPPLPELTDRLRRQARRITGPRQAILDILRRQDHPLAIRDIFAALPAGDCDLATVYRSMHLLEEVGIVQRYDLGDGVARFELHREGHQGHHHHLVCTGCDRVIDLHAPELNALRLPDTRRLGFEIDDFSLHIRGLCADCRAGRRQARRRSRAVRNH